AELNYRPGTEKPWTHDIHLHLSAGKLSHAQIPLPLENVEMSCRCTNGRLTVEQLAAQAGDARLVATGRAMSLDAEADLEGSLKIEHLSVNSDVFQTLPERLQAIQRDYSPEGFADISLDFQRRGGHWREYCQIHPQDATILCAKFPYRLERVSGTLEH